MLVQPMGKRLMNFFALKIMAMLGTKVFVFLAKFCVVRENACRDFAKVS